MTYNFQAEIIDTTSITLSPEIEPLIEKLAASSHGHWAKGRASEGVVYGEKRDDGASPPTNPCMRPYNELEDSEKEYDRRHAIETIKSLIALGWTLTPPAP